MQKRSTNESRVVSGKCLEKLEFQSGLYRRNLVRGLPGWKTMHTRTILCTLKALGCTTIPSSGRRKSRFG